MRQWLVTLRKRLVGEFCGKFASELATLRIENKELLRRLSEANRKLEAVKRALGG